MTAGHEINHPTSSGSKSLVHIGVLGPLTVTFRDEPVILKGKARLLLLWLTLYRVDGIGLDRLLPLMWKEGPPIRAKRQLDILLGSLSQETMQEIVVASSERIRLAADVTRIDADTFPTLVSQPTSDRASVLRSAVDLWRGRPYLEISDELDALSEIRKLEELMLSALEELYSLRLASPGRSSEVVADLQGLLAQHPDREHVNLLTALGLAKVGRRVEALRILHHLPIAVRQRHAHWLSVTEDRIHADDLGGVDRQHAILHSRIQAVLAPGTEHRTRPSL